MTIFIQDLVHHCDHTVRLCYIITSKSISSFHSSSSNSSNYLKHNHSCIHSRNNRHHHTKQQIHLYRNPNPTQWHPVKHKSWRRRRRANHLPVLARNRLVSAVALLILSCPTRGYFQNATSL